MDISRKHRQSGTYNVSSKESSRLKKFLPFLYGQRVNDFHLKKSLEIEEQNWKFIDTRLKTSESKQKKKQFTVRLFDTVEIPQVLRGEQSVKSEPWIAIS